MKARTLMFTVLTACLSILPASASVFGDIRVNARFLTDRMAFELHLSTDQYNDLYEINYDFFTGINPYIARIAAADATAIDLYYRYLDIRNDDLRWVLSNAEYARFIALDYFFHPVYTLNNVCYLRIYKVYPNRNHFYYRPPRHYLTYRGGHCRSHFGGRSYYQHIYPVRYHHPVYAHARPARPHAPHRDFGRPGIRPGRPAPGRPHTPPQKNPGFHFTPSNRHPGNQTDRPGTARPQKPHANRPEAKPGRPNVSRPDRPDTQRKPRTDNRHSGKRQNRSAQQARRNEAKRL